MDYKQFTEEDFVKDEYFQRWVLNPDQMVTNFWDNWIAKHPEKKQTIDNAAHFIKLLNFDADELSNEDFNAMWQNIIQRKNIKSNRAYSQKPSLSRNIKYALRIAAVFVGLLGISFLGYRYFGVEFSKNGVISNQPGITLELDDGTVKILDENSFEIIKDRSGKKIVSHEQNTLLYAGKRTSSLEDVSYNQLTIPYGKKFELVLSDGTHVFLNSGSKLKYPTAFLANGSRNVFLDGEAYFSVKEDKERPFNVLTDEMNTRVFGTEFNVSSYKNENNTSVVLVEGSVGVYEPGKANEKKMTPIAPGQRAVIENGIISIADVNIYKYTAWKDGKLVFVDTPFELILKELERHFNVEIKNEFLKLNEKKFTGTFIDEPLPKILKICQEYAPFNFSIDDNVVTINDME